MLVPLVRTLKAQLPGVLITWIISKPAYFLVEGMEGIDFVVIDKPKSFRDYRAFKKQMKSKTFDVLLATQACLRANLLIPFIKAKRKIGYDAKRAKDGHRLFIHESIKAGQDHTLEGFLKFADALGLPRQKPVWNLPIGSEDYDFASQILPKAGLNIAINPAASKRERSWLVPSYIEVIQYLQREWQANIILTGGPTPYDRELATEILAKVPALDMVGKTKPKQLLALLSQVDLVFCPDTGPSHMAAAVGTPVIALHAVTNPLISGPYPFQDLVVDYYPTALKTILNQSLDEKSWGKQVHDREAMKLIPVDVVIQKLDSILQGLKNKVKISDGA